MRLPSEQRMSVVTRIAAARSFARHLPSVVESPGYLSHFFAAGTHEAITACEPDLRPCTPDEPEPDPRHEPEPQPSSSSRLAQSTMIAQLRPFDALSVLALVFARHALLRAVFLVFRRRAVRRSRCTPRTEGCTCRPCTRTRSTSTPQDPAFGCCYRGGATRPHDHDHECGATVSHVAPRCNTRL